MDNKKKVNSWANSPITKREEVLVEYDDKNGESKMCIGSGFFTNEYPLNYKKHPDFEIGKYEKNMPRLMKDLRFDDGESYWYPTTIQTNEGMVFPDGESKDQWKWCFAPIEDLEKIDENTGSDRMINMKKSKRFDRYIDAIKNLKGVNLDELK